MRHRKLSQARSIVLVMPFFLLFGCSDTATFATGTSIGIAANASSEQIQIGFARAELFQGPNYPDVGDAPPVVGFLGSDLSVISPHIRQLYATGEAARIVTAPGDLAACPADGKDGADRPPNQCPAQTGTLNGERRILVFGTGTSVGLKLGFTGDYPSSINLGYDREELSIIPLHSQAPAADDKKPDDKYTSVLASFDLNLDAPTFLGTDLKLTQFFATGAAARNLAKNGVIRDYFGRTAASAVNPDYVKAALAAIGTDQKAIDDYFDANAAKNFADVRDKLLKDPSLRNNYDGMPNALKTATSKSTFDAALRTKATLYEPIGDVARQLNP